MESLNLREINLFFFVVKWIEQLNPKQEIKNSIWLYFKERFTDESEKICIPKEMYTLALAYDADQDIEAPLDFGWSL